MNTGVLTSSRYSMAMLIRASSSTVMVVHPVGLSASGVTSYQMLRFDKLFTAKGLPNASGVNYPSCAIDS